LTIAFAQTNPAARAAREWRQKHERAIVEEFVSLLAIPNVASDRENIRRNADAIAAMLGKRGVAAKLLSVEGANPLVFGEIRTPAPLARSFSTPTTMASRSTRRNGQLYRSRPCCAHRPSNATAR
jgi:hypothetical protein